MRRVLTGFALLLFAALPASAAVIKLKNGTTVTCKVKRYDEATKILYVTTEDGKDTQYGFDDLDARSAYLVNASLVPKDDAKAQLMVANFARDAGLYAHAARRYGEAVRLDPTLKAEVDKEMTKTRRLAAEMCMSNARAAIAKNDIADAERWLKALIQKLPGEPEAEQASAMLDQYYAKVREERVARADAQASDALKRDVEQGKRRYQEMVDKSKRGLQTKGTTEAINLFRGALVDGKAVMDEIDGIEKKYETPQVKEQASGYRAVVTKQIVEIHMSIASLLATRSDYQGAQQEVNKALAVDPQNEEALSMRARIEDYASNSGGWRPWI